MSLNSSLAVGPNGALLETGVRLQINIGTDDKPVWKDLNCIVNDDLDLPEPKPPRYRRLLPGDLDNVPPHPMCRCDIGMNLPVYKCPSHLADWALNYIRKEKVRNFIKRLKTRLKH